MPRDPSVAEDSKVREIDADEVSGIGQSRTLSIEE